jgi:hypothetical protein
MIEALIERLAELNNLIGVEGDFLLPDEQVELTGIEEILAEESITS